MTEHTVILPASGGEAGPGPRYRFTLMVPKARFLEYLLARWWVLLIGVTVLPSAVLVYETVRSPTYESFAELYAWGNVQLAVTSLVPEESLNYFGTQIQLLKGQQLRLRAYEEAGAGSAANEALAVEIEAVQPMKTSIVQLRAFGADPVFTARYLEALIQVYLDFKKRTRASTAEDVLAALGEQLRQRADALKQEQDRLTDFQRLNNAAVLEEEGRTAGIHLADLNLQRAKTRLELALIETGGPNPAPAAVDSGAPSTSALARLAVLKDPGRSALKQELGLLLLQREEKARIYKDQHPRIRKLDEEIARLQTLADLFAQQEQAETDTQNDVLAEALRRREAAVETALATWEKKVLEINARLAEMQRLKNAVAREQGHYDNLLALFRNADLGTHLQQEKLSVLQPPTLARPVERVLLLRLGLAAGAGLAFGLGLVLVWDRLDDRLLTARELREHCGERLRGEIPRVAGRRPADLLLQPTDPRFAYVQAFYHLRSSVWREGVEASRPGTLLIASAGPGEGKTTVATNLARILALTGLKVVLVDADLRRGQVHELLGLPRGPGLADWLEGRAPMNAIVCPTEVPGWSVIPCGNEPQEATRLLHRPELSQLFDGLASRFDAVLVDSPPILAADDTPSLAVRVGAVLLVVRRLRTRARWVRHCLDILYQRGVKTVDLVFNAGDFENHAPRYAATGLGRRQGRPPTGETGPQTTANRR